MIEDKPDKMWQWAVGVLLLLPVIYFLSYGPMSKLYYDASSDAFDLLYEILYLPIEWLWQNTPLDGPIDWYEELWE
jgi:hypothetical protein